MKARFHTLLVFISLLALFTASFQIYLPIVSKDACSAAERGLAFLKARYNPVLGLLNESPIIFPYRYWLTNDNALAAYAFERYGQTSLSSAIWTSVRLYGRDTNGLIEVVWGIPVEFPPYDKKYVLVPPFGEEEIWQELHIDGLKMEDWAEYANLSFLAALNESVRGRPAEALDTFSLAMDLYRDLGFRDKAFYTNNLYDTYKLALALYVGAAIHAPMPNASALRARLLSMQAANGGFITGYTLLGEPIGDANTETTSLALLALKDGCR